MTEEKKTKALTDEELEKVNGGNDILLPPSDSSSNLFAIDGQLSPGSVTEGRKY